MKPSVQAFDPDKFRCLEKSNLQTASIDIIADGGREFSFASAHYLDTELSANPGSGPEDSPERLELRFSTGTVVLLGRGLARIREALATGCLGSLQPVAVRHVALVKNLPIITSIKVTRKENL